MGKDAEDVITEKLLVVQIDGKECVFKILKGIYAFEVLLSNNEVYKKGEFKLEHDSVITIKKEE